VGGRVMEDGGGEAVYGWEGWVGRGLRIRMGWCWEFYILGLGLGVEL